jgi:thiol-disulfide isomerase/thioredoxin
MPTTILIGCFVFAGLEASENSATAPREQYQALQREYNAAFQAFVKANEEAKTDADFAKIGALPGGNPKSFTGGFIALAKKYPGTEAAEDALVWVASHVLIGAETEEAKRLLIRDHIRSTKLGPVFAFQRNTCGSAATERLLREAMTKNPQGDIQGLACYWLAHYLTEQAQWSREARRVGPDSSWAEFVNMIPPAPLVVEGWGADYIDRLRQLDPWALDREAEALLTRVVANYASSPNNDKTRRRETGTLGDAARADLHEMRDLAIGKPTPEIEGKDLNGRPFRLSDYRSKVVVLAFGSYFYCGSCRALYPHERSLVKRLEGRPFALVSINAEPSKGRAELKKAWEDAGNTWRCVWDGDYDGPINTAWDIRNYPTIYVLDQNGVIRYKNVFTKDLDVAVDTLLKEQESGETAKPARR